MSELSSIITAAANRYGMPPETLLRIAQIESGMNPNAANPNSSARGLFQFVGGTWKGYGQGQNPLDPVANADAGARFTRDNYNTLRNRLGRDPEGWELYLAHQQGAGGALKLLSNPNARAADVTSPEAIRLNAGNTSGSAGDFANLWKAKYEGTPVPAAGGTVEGTVTGASAMPMPLAGGVPREELLLGSLFNEATAPLRAKPQAPLVERKKKSIGESIGDLGAPVRLSSV
jgi:hypothetical protein